MKTYEDRTRRNLLRKRTSLLAGTAWLLVALGMSLETSATAASRESQPGKGAELLMRLAREYQPPSPLPYEADVPLLKELGAQYDLLAATTNLVDTVRQGHHARVAIQRRGNPEAPVLIAVHGLLADHTSWRYVAGELGSECEFWLVDLPGCGLSDKPHPRHLAPDGYSPSAMGERVLQALDPLLASLPASRRVLLTAHSLGGLVALHMFGDPDLRRRHAQSLQRIERLILFAPCDDVINAEVPVFMPVARLKGWQVTVGSCLGVLQSKVTRGTADSFPFRERATMDRAQFLCGILRRADTRHAAIAMIRQAIPWNVKQHGPIWDAAMQRVRWHQAIPVPSLIVWGERDASLPESMGHKLQNEIPGSTLVVVAESGHSLPLERPLECSDLIRRFAAGRTRQAHDDSSGVRMAGGRSEVLRGTPAGLELRWYDNQPSAANLADSAATMGSRGNLGNGIAEDR